MVILNTFLHFVSGKFGAAKHSLFWFDDATMDWSCDLSDRKFILLFKRFIGYKYYSFVFLLGFVDPLKVIMKYDFVLMDEPITQIIICSCIFSISDLIYNEFFITQ